MFRKIICLVSIVLSIIGLISLYLSYLPALNYAFKGDVANATNAIVNATATNLVEKVKWTAISSLIIAIASMFGLGAIAKKILG